MKKYKTLIAFIVLILLLAGFIALVYNGRVAAPEVFSARQDLKVTGMVDTIRQVDSQITLLDRQFSRIKGSSANLMAYGLGQLTSEDGYKGPESFDNGIVVRIVFARVTPDRPSRRMARSTAPREALGIAVRRISAVIFLRP